MTRPIHVLYVVPEWRTPTQTFIRREIDAARTAGDRVTVLSLKRPVRVDPDDPAVIRPPRGPRLLIGIAIVAMSKPIKVLSTLVRALRGSRLDTVNTNLGSVVLGMASRSRVPDDVDVVLAHFAWAAASAADGLSSVRGDRYSVFAHAHDIFDHDYVDRYTGTKLRRARLVAVESESIREEVDARFGCRAVVVRMGVPASYLVGDPDRRQPDRGLVVSVGSLLPKKGHGVLIEAASRVPGARVTIIGEGPEQGALRLLSEQLGCGDRVCFTGQLAQEEVLGWLDRAQIFCLASRPLESGDRDGVPNVLIEAMARGVPVVSTRVSGIPDLLGEGRGIVVQPDDVEALSVAFVELFTDGDHARRLGSAGFDHVAQHYTTERNWGLLQRALVGRRNESADRAAQRSRLDPSITEHNYLQLRALARSLCAEAKSIDGGLMVDVGCGAKPYEQLFDVELVGFDLTTAHGDPDVVADASSLPIKNGSADFVISTQQLEHVDDPRILLSEAHRVLTTRGVLLLSTHGVWPHHPDPHDLWRWTEEGLIRLISDAGFDVERVHRHGNSASVAIGLVMYPLGGLGRRVPPARPFTGATCAVMNVVGRILESLWDRAIHRHYVSASYLVVANSRP